MRRRHLVTVLLALVLGACGGATTGEGPVAVLAAAPDAAEEAGSARFTMDMTLSGAPQGDVSLGGEGAIDFDTQRMRVNMDMGAMLPGGASGGDGTVEMLMDGTSMYVAAGMFGSMLPQGVRWVRIDLQQLAERSGMDLGGLTAGGQTNPTAYLETLRGVSDDIEEVGTEEIRGVSTTHYRATVDMRKALEQVSEESRDQLEAMLGETGSPTSIPVDVWIDGEGRPARFQMDTELEVPEAGTVTQSLTMEYFDWGAEVDLELPPGEQTVDLQELMGSLPTSAPTG